MRNPAIEVSIVEVQRDRALEPAVVPLASAEVHIWQFPLAVSEQSASESPLADYAQLLSSDERLRASRFHFEKDARKFTVARATMRAILAVYALSPTGALRFIYSQNEKPALSDNSLDVRFNLSHSADMALLGVSLGREVGVDVEAIRPDVETDKLAQRFFSIREREAISTLPEKERIRAFFRCWTCKEAFLKAQGVGLSRSLESFDVEVKPERPARLMYTRPDPAEAERWSLHDVEIGSGYAAAVAVEGSIRAMKILRSR